MILATFGDARSDLRRESLGPSAIQERSTADAALPDPMIGASRITRSGATRSYDRAFLDTLSNLARHTVEPPLTACRE